MEFQVSFGAAVLAGLVSFLSPCVLPLVPPYLCFISGQSLEEMTDRRENERDLQVLMTALAFVLGFTSVFVFLGAGASTIGQVLKQHLFLLGNIAGLFIIAMGLHFIGVFRIGILGRELRFHQSSRPRGLLGAYGVGIAFAFGWTPCIGPTLGAIFSVAASEDSVAQGMLLLGFYSLGLGVPFLLAALSVGHFLRFFQSFRKQLRNVERVMGVALVLTGIMFITGSMQTLSYWLIDMFPGLASIG